MNPTANNWQYYAVTPLAKAPVKSRTTICTYNIDAGLSQEQQLVIDTALPALLVRECLHQLDMYRVFAAGLNRELLSNDANEAIGRITIAINDIISIIVDSVVPLFQYQPNSMYHNAARQTVRSQLEEHLADVYSAAVVMVSTITGNAMLYHDGIAYPELETVSPYSIPHPAISAAPFLINQNAAAAYPGSVDIAQLNRWMYTTSFSRNAIAYGSKAFIQFRLEDPAANNTTGIEVNSVLLNSLLQFTTVAPQIISVLQASTTTTAQQLTALQTVARLTAILATSWKAEPVIAMAAPADTTAAAWQLEEYTDTDANGEQAGMVLRKPVNEDWPYDYWPQIFLDDSSTALPSTLLGNDTCFYAACLEKVYIIRIALPQLHAFTQSKVSAGIAIQQNCFGNSILAPNPAFAAFVTPFTWLPAAARPHLYYASPIVLPGSDAATALQHLFQTLTGSETTTLLRATINYQYHLDKTDLPVTLLVLLLPYTQWQQAITLMPNAIQQWVATFQPPPGYFTMEASLADENGVELMLLDRCELKG